MVLERKQGNKSCQTLHILYHFICSSQENLFSRLFFLPSLPLLAPCSDRVAISHMLLLNCILLKFNKIQNSFPHTH